MIPLFLLSTTLTRIGTIYIRYETDVVRARNLGSLLAQEMQFDKTSSIRIGTAISELSRNIVERTSGGTIDFLIAKSKDKNGFVAIFKDEGEVIKTPDEIKSADYKLAGGLAGSQRLMDDFEIETVSGSGTKITAAKWLPQFIPELTDSRIEQIATAFGTTIERGELSMVETINAQNKELIYLLKSIKERNEEIESINKELEETNRGVLALNSELQDKSIAIENAKQTAEQANKAKSDFLAHMSHEIRTPMNAILGFTDLILKTELSKIQRQYTENIYIAGKELLEIINDILDLSKIEAGKLELDIVPVDLFELIDQVLELMKVSAFNKKLSLILSEQPGLPQFILADPIRLKQILLNLIANAIKFTERGRVELKIDYDQISEKVYKITFSVIDTGIGISEDQKSKLFKAFSQSDTSTTRKFGGTGLGLIISNLLAKKMGSYILLDSEPEKGSTFHFELETSISQETGYNPALIYKKVLILNPGDLLRNIISHLEYWCIKYDFCRSSSQLSVKLQQSEPDLLILNLIGEANHDYEYLISEIMNSLSGNIPVPDIIIIDRIHEDSRFKEIEHPRLSILKTTLPLNTSKLFYTFYIKKENVSENDPVQNIKPNKEPFQHKGFARKVILLAEDNKMNMFLIIEILNAIIQEPVILEAVNGAEAIDIILNNKVDLVLMDVQMPVIDGLTATKKIRQMNNSQYQSLPIIALTAGALAEEKQRVFESGMNEFLTKPIIECHLIDVLKKYLST